MSYAELARLVAGTASSLGTSRRLVLLEAERDLSSVVTYLACLAAGHPVIVATACSVPGLREVFDPDVVVTRSRVGWETEEVRRGSRHELHRDLAVLMSTSGSTGSPRLVRLSAANLDSNAKAIADYMALRPEDVAVTTLPLSYCYGLSILQSHLHVGASVLLADTSVTDSSFWESARAAGVSMIAGVPMTFDLLDRVGFSEKTWPQLRLVTQAGGRLSPDSVRRFAELGQRRGFDFVVMYGQTEATARMAYLPADLAASHPDAVGVPIPGGSFRLVTPAADPSHPCGETCSGSDVPVGSPGELVYEGPNVMLGYAEAPRDLAKGAEMDHLHTGDLAEISSDGLVRVVGRLSRFVKVMGLRVDLARVELTLLDSGLTAACLGGDDKLVVAVAAGSARHLTARDVTSRVGAAAGLAPGAVSVRWVDELPRTISGKVDLPALERAVKSSGCRGTSCVATDESRPPEAESDDSAPETLLESLRRAYAVVLDRDFESVGSNDSFVGLGGDSMTFVALSLRVERLLGTVPSDWHVMSPRDLAGYATADAASAGAPRRWCDPRAVRVVETAVALRALAIVLVVGTHAGAFYVLGGAHLLVALAGYNVARFHLTDESPDRRSAALRRTLSRVLIPTLIWLTLLVLLSDQYGPRLFFATTVLGSNETAPEWRYWFIEALVYFLVVAVVVTRSRIFHRLERARPVATPLLLLVPAVLLWAVVAADAFPRSEISVAAVAWLFVLGWLLARLSSNRSRLAAGAAMIFTLPFMYDDESRWMLVVGGLLAVVFVPRLRLPRVVVGAAGAVASASLFVYLSHYQTYPLVGSSWLGVGLSLVVGVVLWQVYSRTAAGVSGWRRRRLQRDGINARTRGQVQVGRPAEFFDQTSAPTPVDQSSASNLVGVGR